jgi:glycosyltransferase involved in cell wall biosynthesis
VGGAARAVYQLVQEELVRDDWAIAVVFGRAEGFYAEAIRSLGCDTLDLQMRRGADLPRALQATERLRDFDIHHFHALELTEILASARCNGVARIYTHRHGIYEAPEPVAKNVRRALGGALLRRYFHAVAGNTEHATRYAVSRYGLERLPSFVTYNGLDFSLLTPTRKQTDVRQELGARPDDFLVGYSGTFKREKRLDRLVSLLETSPNIQVVLVGDGALRGTLEAQAQALGVGNRLHITGLVNDVADYLQTMDAFVLPSSAEESFGNSVVEAMALGVPSIVFSDSPGPSEHIENGVTGFVVDGQSDLASVLDHLAQHPDLRVQIGQAGSKHVRSKYTLARMHEAYRELYEAAVAYAATGHPPTTQQSSHLGRW